MKILLLACAIKMLVSVDVVHSLLFASIVKPVSIFHLLGFGGSVHFDECNFFENLNLDQWTSNRVITIQANPGEVRSIVLTL